MQSAESEATRSELEEIKRDRLVEKQKYDEYKKQMTEIALRIDHFKKRFHE